MPEKKKKEGKKAIRKKLKTTWDEFRKFISRGSIIDLAVGVIIGGAFNAIVTSLVSILMSICTWGVPGGISGLVTVLPAANSAQAGVPGIGQKFAADGDTISAMVEIYANEFGLTGAMTTARSELLGKYTLHGGTYYYNGSALIDWGSFINAVISFLVIAITLFVIVKVFNYLQKKRELIAEKAREEHYKKHPEDRPLPPKPEEPKPTELDVLIEIRDQLAKANAGGNPDAVKTDTVEGNRQL